MPELPELDVLAENLAARLGGATVASVQVVSVAALKTFDPPIDALVGQTVTGAGRRAKYVWLELAGQPSTRGAHAAGSPSDQGDPTRRRYSAGPPGKLFLVVHLSLGGRLAVGAKPAGRKVAVLTVGLDDGRVLSMAEGGSQRRAAVWLVDDVEKVPGLAGLGPEPLDPGFTVERLAAILAEGGHTLKWMLTDQRAMAGVGNGWSDDVLHRAKLSPFARPERLDAEEVARLHAALVGVLTEARGSLAEQAGGEVELPRAAERRFAVHGRAGAACFVCGDTIRSVWMGERETSYCPTCQTGGRVLADRRRSRFLR
jgi:formamidopyrimidine-DNA glycosylase